MVTYKVLLDTRRAKSDSTYAVTIRTTWERKSTTTNTGVSIPKQYWNEQQSCVAIKHPNAKLLNKRITEHYLKLQKAVLELEDDGGFSFEALKEKLNDSHIIPKLKRSMTFKNYAEQLITEMLDINKAGNAIIYRTAINRLLAFTKNEKLQFVEIDFSLLDAFKRKLVQEGIKQNSISNYFRTLRAVYNKAIKAKLVDKSRYPFLDLPIKVERTAKRAITIDNLQAIAKLEFKPRSQEWHARNYFFLSFALIGASFTDLCYLTSANINKGRIIYKRRKTGQELTIKLLPYTEKLLNYYSGTNAMYLIPVLPPDVVQDGLRAKHIIMQSIKQTNKYLKRIGKTCNIDNNITTYVARHTWATTAKRLGYSIELIAEALGHEHGNKITNIYLDSFDQTLIDDANARIVQLIE
ncbi:phage integrase SAM-like domain-containing protein [Mucilaginibacter sp.]